MNLKTRTLFAVLLILATMMTGCKQSPITTLQLALDAIAVALPVVAGLTNIPAPLLASVETYLSQTNEALDKAAAILATNETDGQKAAQIIAVFTAIAAPDIPAQYQQLAQLVETISADVAAFVVNFMETERKSVSVQAHVTKPSSDDQAKLAAAKSTAEKNRATLLKLRH